MDRGMRAAYQPIESLAQRRSRFFTRLAWGTAASAGVGALMLTLLGRLWGFTPASKIVPIAVGVMVLSLVALWLDQRLQTIWAVVAYLVGLTVAAVGLMVLASGYN